MADDESHHFSMVANFTPTCKTTNCPYRYVDLPHNATQEMVVRRCYELTTTTQNQMRTSALTYAHQVNSLRRIMSTVGGTNRLDEIRLVIDLFDATFTAEYETYMHRNGDFTQPPGRGVSASSAAGDDGWNATAGPSASGSEGTAKRDSRYMEEEEYPRWEFRGGKAKKLKWMAYYREPTEQLEEAFRSGCQTLILKIDEWQYEIDLANLRQRSIETSTCREVRRLTGPPTA